MTHQTARNAQAALVRAAASFVRDTYSGEWADDAAATLETDADLIERGEPCSLLRLAETMQPAAVSAAVAPPTNQTALRETIADVGVTPPPALTEEGRLRAQVQVLQQDAERDQGLAKVGARCMREGHQGLIESGRATIEGHRFALSVALGLGTGAPWDAIHERVKELRRLADETVTNETARGCPPDCPCHAVCIGTLKPATGASAAPVQHAPGKAVRCPDCRTKGYTVCLDEPTADARGPVAADQCPRCRNDNSEAWALCSACAAGARQDGATP